MTRKVAGRTLSNFLAERGSPVYEGIADPNDYAQQFWRCRWAEREIAARVYDFRLLDNVVAKQEVPEFFIAPATGKAFHQLQTLQHDLEEIARFYEHPPRRDPRRPEPRPQFVQDR